MKNFKNSMFILLKNVCFSTIFIFLTFSFIHAQSTNQTSPTFVTSNEISGTIPARDIGDSRLTNYFYTFNGNQGDVFINVVTQNLDGDIDVFTIDGLKPLTKITIFSDNSANETGRIVYLRKFEKLLLRIQGRSPNDETATFKVKFAGSFQPLQNVAGTKETKLPEINTINPGEVRVNSVGTIIAVVPKPTPEPKNTAIVESETKVTEPETENTANKEINVTSVDEATVSETATKIEIKKGSQNEIAETNEIETSVKVEEIPKISKPVVIISEDSIPTETKIINEDPEVSDIKKTEKTDVEVKVPTVEIPEKIETIENKNDLASKAVRPLKIEELQKIELVVQFKDGKNIKQPMSKVFSFNVNQGILTIVLYDGTISRYSLLVIEKISIEGNENK